MSKGGRRSNYILILIGLYQIFVSRIRVSHGYANKQPRGREGEKNERQSRQYLAADDFGLLGRVEAVLRLELLDLGDVLLLGLLGGETLVDVALPGPQLSLALWWVEDVLVQWF